MFARPQTLPMSINSKKAPKREKCREEAVGISPGVGFPLIVSPSLPSLLPLPSSASPVLLTSADWLKGI